MACNPKKKKGEQMRKILFILLLSFGFSGFGKPIKKAKAMTKKQERVIEETKQMALLAQTYDLEIKPDWLKNHSMWKSFKTKDSKTCKIYFDKLIKNQRWIVSFYRRAFKNAEDSIKIFKELELPIPFKFETELNGYKINKKLEYSAYKELLEAKKSHIHCPKESLQPIKTKEVESI